MRIELLDRNDADRYEHFIKRCENANVYASWGYREVLEDTLDAEGRYLALVNGSGDITGVLPAFVAHHSEYGSVLNSLPFFGSYGGAILEAADPDKAGRLIDGFDDLARQLGCVSSTVVVSPLDVCPDVYESRGYDARDTRIGQVTPLPGKCDNLEDRLFDLYDGVRRRNIRKARKEGVTVRAADSREALDFVASVHSDNMVAIGGKGKPDSFYASIADRMLGKAECRLYMAYLGEVPIAGLLAFHHNVTADYFIPAAHTNYRRTQGMCLCIHEALADAARQGMRQWNWGGTWRTQDGVYNFKSKWGTQDIPYHYYTRLYDGSETLRRMKPAELGQAYPYFFVMSYGLLINDESPNE